MRNLLLLCPFHHHLVHRSGTTIDLDPDTAEVEFRRTDGTLVAARTVDPEDAPPRVEVAGDALTPGEAGTRLPLDDIIENMADRDDRVNAAAA